MMLLFKGGYLNYFATRNSINNGHSIMVKVVISSISNKSKTKRIINSM